EQPEGVPLAPDSGLTPGTEPFAAAARVIRDMPDDLRAQLAGVEASSAQQVTFILKSGTRVMWGSATATQQKAVVLRAMLTRLGSAQTIDVSAPDTPVFT